MVLEINEILGIRPTQGLFYVFRIFLIDQVYNNIHLIIYKNHN